MNDSIINTGDMVDVVFVHGTGERLTGEVVHTPYDRSGGEGWGWVIRREGRITQLGDFSYMVKTG